MSDAYPDRCVLDGVPKAETAPEAADELLSAASLYDEVADAPGIWMWGHEMGDDVQDALADRETRLGVAAQIRVAGHTEARAVELIETPLAG